jgi:hypothetical protein
MPVSDRQPGKVLLGLFSFTKYRKGAVLQCSLQSSGQTGNIQVCTTHCDRLEALKDSDGYALAAASSPIVPPASNANTPGPVCIAMHSILQMPVAWPKRLGACGHCAITIMSPPPQTVGRRSAVAYEVPAHRGFNTGATFGEHSIDK